MEEDVVSSDPYRSAVQLGKVGGWLGVFQFPDRRDLSDGDIVEHAERSNDDAREQ